MTTSATIHAVMLKNYRKSSIGSRIFKMVLPIGVALSPLNVTLSPAQSQIFTADVSNASSLSLTRSLNRIPGSTFENSLDTVPASISTPETVAIGASSVAYQTKTATPNATLTGAIGASLPPGPLLLPQGFMPSVKAYGAVGNGVADDTAAIQAALADGRTDPKVDYYGRPKALYFPPGTYLVHQTLQWVGCCLTLQGAGSSASVIRLAPKSDGFGDPANPKPLILTPLGNQSFRQNIWDMGLLIGANNPGATALSYVSNNSGAVHNVLIQSEDGRGHAGIDLTRQYAGPLMIRNTEIRGFDVGVDLKNAEYSSTFEAITLKNQHIAGVRNVNQAISIRGLASTNTVPALTNSGGSVVLLDAKLLGGDPSSPALQTNSAMYLRNVVSDGYGSTVLNTTGASPAIVKGSIGEYLAGSPQTLTGKMTSRSLMLPVKETPSYVSSTLIDWAVFTPRWYGDTSTLQPAMNSGKHTVYFPFAAYFSYDEASINVPDTVDRIVGFSSVVNGSTAGKDGGSIRLVVTSNSTTPLIIEQFGYGLKIDHRGSRPIVIKDAFLGYQSRPGAGDLFLEDVELGPLAMQPGQHVWARQFNNEFSGTKISNPGGSLWVLGLKTEQAGTVINTTSGGATEVLGALIYPSTSVPAADVAFRSTDSRVSYIYSESVYCPSCGYATQVQETRAGTTKTMGSPASSAYRTPLFIGFN